MSSNIKQTYYRISEASEKFGLKEEFLIHCIEANWVIPVAPEEHLIDEEDLARAKLIQELIQEFGVNNEAIPIILHLLDQLYYLEHRIEKKAA